jgi:hypothetical protein
VPLVTVDTSVTLPATLRASAMPRKLWVLLAFGGLVYEAKHRRLDLDALRREAEATGGSLGGIHAAEQQIVHVEERQALLAERLPYGAPDDWAAAGNLRIRRLVVKKLNGWARASCVCVCVARRGRCVASGAASFRGIASRSICVRGGRCFRLARGLLVCS